MCNGNNYHIGRYPYEKHSPEQMIQVWLKFFSQMPFVHAKHSTRVSALKVSIGWHMNVKYSIMEKIRLRSFYLHNGIVYTARPVFWYWNKTLDRCYNQWYGRWRISHFNEQVLWLLFACHWKKGWNLNYLTNTTKKVIIFAMRNTIRNLTDN